MQWCVYERTVITPQKRPLAEPSKTVIIMSVNAASSSSLASGGSGLRVNNLSRLSGNAGSGRQREGKQRVTRSQGEAWIIASVDHK